MDCFEDIIKTNNNFDKTLNTIISRFSKTNDSKILVTESPNLAANYQLINGLTPLESWSFPQLNCLSFPLITSKDISDGNECVYAVQEPNSLTKWSFGDQKRRLERHIFNTSLKIAALVGFDNRSVDRGYVQPVVVYENGFCQTISSAINTKTEENKQRIISEDESIQFIDGFVDKKKSNDFRYIYLITKSKTSTDNTIENVYKLKISVKADVIVKSVRQSVVNRYNNWSLCHKTATIWAVSRLNQEFVVFSLNGKTETQFLNLKKSSIESLYSLGTTSIGSVCLIGKTKDKHFSIELWESKYGSKLGQMALPYEPLINDCKVIDNSIFITCFKGIVLVPIKTQTISLSQIVGKNQNKESVLDSDVMKQLNQICIDLKADQSIDEINESFADITRHMSGNIPEEMILKLLTVCSQKLTQNNSLKLFFEKLVCLPFNELFMVCKLKSSKLTFPQILSILMSLTELLPSSNCAIIDWISILIDSNINQFIMNPNEDTIKVIEQIHLKIDNFGQFCEQLGQTKTFFEIILSKKLNKSVSKCSAGLIKPERGQYCIEKLRF